MKVVNKIDLKLDQYEKCHLTCDSDIPLGQLYDYACALKSFISGKIKESEDVAIAAAAAADKIEAISKV